MKEKTDIITELKDALKARTNPSDLKEIHIGVVVNVEPVIVTIFEGQVTLKEEEELFISEWFRFRCNIDKTGALSSDVPEALKNAKNITETHSYTGTSCIMPQAISFLASAIKKVNDELFALKCDLKIGDFVAIGSLAQQDKYILIDKVLNDVSGS